MKKLLLGLALLFILIRLPFLNQIFLLHDERDIVFSGYSIAKTGKDLFGNFFPLHFMHISPNNPLFAIYFSALWSFFVPIRTVFAARLPFVLVSAFLVFLVYWITFTVSKNKQKSLLTTIIFCFSPWVFHLTRLALDIPLAIVFLLAGVLLYLKQKRILSYVLFFLTFYTYEGFRLLIPFLILYLELFFVIRHGNRKNFFIKNTINLIFVVFLIISTLVIDRQTTQSRLGEIIFFNKPQLTQDVTFKRMTSIAPDTFKKLFSNKLTSSLDYMLGNFAKGQDISYLFEQGDYSAINGNTAAGQFFLAFILFYYLGFISFGKKPDARDFFLSGFAAIGMIPSLLSTNGSSFAIRSMFSGVGFAFIIASGIAYAIPFIRKSIKLRLLAFILVIITAVNITDFAYNYYERRPVTVSELFNENERTLSAWLMSHKNTRYVIYSKSPQDVFLSIVYMDNKPLNLNAVQESLKKGYPFVWKNITVTHCTNLQDFMMKSNSLISDRCLDPEQFQQFSDINNKRIKERIMYKDYSEKPAYFLTR